ncbi:MAG TPA: hypothetical protein VGO53_00595 [Steroidobacteraceae bacterium]|nr:hypothetical protein [Steroidobacteraceae bacterium]
MWRTVIGAAAFVAVALYLLSRYRRERDRRRREPERFYARAMGVLEGAELQDTGTVGYPRLVGRYGGFPVQVAPVVDTLPTRRLPALWLLVTLQDALPTVSRFDLMMRPTAATTFSNFDLLPATVPRPAGFPEASVLRTDDEDHLLSPHVVAPHLDIFDDTRAKELLITPNGVRFVWLLAEASRARYGVFREADFRGADLDPELLRNLFDRLIAIRASILKGVRATA